MKDCAKQTIEVGMECVTNYQGYLDLIVCKVIGFSPKKVRLLTVIDGEEDEFHKFPTQVAIIKPTTLYAVSTKDTSLPSTDDKTRLGAVLYMGLDLKKAKSYMLPCRRLFSFNMETQEYKELKDVV